MPWYGFGFSAAVLAATAAIMEKWLLKRMDVYQLSALFSLATALFVIPMLLSFKGTLYDLRMEFWGVILLKATAEAVQFVSVMYGIQRLGISTTIPLMALSPGLVAVAGTVFIGDALTAEQWLGLLLMVAGMYLIQLEGDSAWWRPLVRLITDRSQWVIALALSVSVLVALLDKTILSGIKIPPQIFITVQQWYLAAIFLLVLTVRKMWGRGNLFPISWSVSVVSGLLALAVVTVGYRYLQMRGVMLAPVALVLAVRRTSVVMASLIGGSLFQEKGFVRRSAAALILCLGAVLISQNG